MSARQSLPAAGGRPSEYGAAVQPTPPLAKAAPAAGDKLAYIDAVRGWAVLLVIICHAGAAVGNVPYPIHKLTNFGWYGVELFFLASAVTLMMSWQRNRTPTATTVRDFFLRRYWRIAPMYYLGALLYFVLEPPAHGFDTAQLLRAFTFTNAWSPDWIPTTRGWMVVPGGWSIGVEFTFYAVFPLLATFATSLRRALLLFGISIVGAVAANHFGAEIFSRVGPTALTNFLYFWFPNQAPVFALGLVLYQLLAGDWIKPLSRGVSYGLIVAAVAISVVVAEAPWQPQYFNSLVSAPPVLVATLALMLFVIALAKGPSTLFTHRWMQRLGVISFSCYVLHFLFVDKLPVWGAYLIGTRAVGMAAAGQAFVLCAATLAATIAVATLTHRWIEKPGMRVAKWLIAPRWRGAVAISAAS